MSRKLRVFLQMLLIKTLNQKFRNFRINWRPNRPYLGWGLPSKGSPKKVIIKLNRRKDIHRILSNKSKLKNLKPVSVHLPRKTKVFIHESLCFTTRNWSKCKRWWSAGHISAFWIRNVSLRIKLSNESVSIITHDCDLVKFFPDNSLIVDNYLLIDFNIFNYVNKHFKIKLLSYYFA